jgi:hypothetical protein
VILLAHAREVPHDIDFADFGPGEAIACEIGWYGIVGNGGGGKSDASAVWAAELENRWFDGHSLRVPFLQVLTGALRNRRYRCAHGRIMPQAFA